MKRIPNILITILLPAISSMKAWTVDNALIDVLTYNVPGEGSSFMSSLASLYRNLSKDDMVILSHKFPKTERRKAAGLTGSKFKIDDITELTYLDFITAEDIPVEKWARAELNRAFPKNKKGAVNMCILLLKGKAENPGTAANYLTAINDIRKEYRLTESVGDINKMYVKTIAEVIMRLAVQSYRKQGLYLSDKQISLMVAPITAYYKNPTDINYIALTSHIKQLYNNAIFDKKLEPQYLAFWKTIDSLSKGFAKKVEEDADKINRSLNN